MKQRETRILTKLSHFVSFLLNENQRYGQSRADYDPVLWLLVVVFKCLIRVFWAESCT